MSELNSTISLTSNEEEVYKVYRRRFYIIIVFGFLSFNQSLFWLTFSPIARNAEIYYNITEADIDLFLNWGNIICLPTFPFAYLLLNKVHGLRWSVIIFAVTCCIGNILRLIPSFIRLTSSSIFHSTALPLLHAGQILNAAVAPLVQLPVSQLSCMWFGPNERTRATTFAITINSFGIAVGLLISPFIVEKPEHIPRLLYFHLGLAVLACLLTFIYFPSHAPKPPSPAAERLSSYSADDSNNTSLKIFIQDLWTCMKSPAFMLLSIAGGLTTSTFSTWTGLFDTILEPEHYTEEQAGWFGFGTILAGVLGGFIFGALADMQRFQRSLKILAVISLIGCLLLIIWFELSVHTLFYDKPLLSSTSVTIGLSTALAGFFQGASSPLIYEALSETMFPMPESISSFAINQWGNVSALVLLFLAPNRYKLTNFLVLVIVGVCVIMVSAARVVYRRRDVDHIKQLAKNNQEILNNDQSNTSSISTCVN